MNEPDFIRRIDALLATPRDSMTGGHEMFQGALTLLVAVHGSDSIQVKALTKEAEQIRAKYAPLGVNDFLRNVAEGALRNLKAEVNDGIIGSLQRTVTGDVLTDFIKLARAVFEEPGDGAKNVSAVLAASVYEDTIRRLAITSGIPHLEKLAAVLNELKDKGVLQGSQVGIAQSYLNFRNNALHAQWDKIEREAIASILAFSEQLLLKYF